MHRKMLTQTLASLAVAASLGACVATSSAAIDPSLLPFYKPMVTQVPDRATATIATFRATDPVTVPPIVKLYGEVDPATGQTLLGMNAELARPAYPFGTGSGKPHFWLVPAAGNSISAIEFDKKGREADESGLTFKVSKTFEKYGHVEWWPPSSAKMPTEIRGIVPDSIKTFKIITKRRSKKPLTKTYKVRNNAIMLDLKKPTYIVLGGKRFKIQPSKGAGYFTGEYLK
ncbi:MAG: hypothetical protein JHC98_12215 [Thermoleophilaceae bacterium]|nr:hypothetical protein [Thermoleophilaceae bacterium]